MQGYGGQQSGLHALPDYRRDAVDIVVSRDLSFHEGRQFSTTHNACQCLT